MKTDKFSVEITSESGNIIDLQFFEYEITAQHHFDKLAEIRYPNTYKNLTMNCSEYPENRIGSLILIAENKHGQFCRRELYRKP